MTKLWQNLAQGGERLGPWGGKGLADIFLYKHVQPGEESPTISSKKTSKTTTRSLQNQLANYIMIYVMQNDTVIRYLNLFNTVLAQERSESYISGSAKQVTCDAPSTP